MIKRPLVRRHERSGKEKRSGSAIQCQLRYPERCPARPAGPPGPSCSRALPCRAKASSAAGAFHPARCPFRCLDTTTELRRAVHLVSGSLLSVFLPPSACVIPLIPCITNPMGIHNGMVTGTMPDRIRQLDRGAWERSMLRCRSLRRNQEPHTIRNPKVISFP